MAAVVLDRKSPEHARARGSRAHPVGCPLAGHKKLHGAGS